MARFTRSLYLSGCGLNEIPFQIFELSTLQHLDLSFNQITEIPKEIRRMACLQTLNLSGNLLSSLPAEITILPNLIQLDVSQNDLLPKEIQIASLNGTLYDLLSQRSIKSSRVSKKTKILPGKSTAIADLKRLSQTVRLFPKSTSKLSPEAKQDDKSWSDQFQFLEIFPESSSKSNLYHNNRAELNSNILCEARLIRANKEEKIQLLNQLSIFSRLEHPNVNKLLGAIEFNKRKIKIEPPCDDDISSKHMVVLSSRSSNGSLQDWLAQQDNKNIAHSSIKMRFMIAQQVVEGLDYLHSCNPPIIHHNLKPSNILLSSDMQAKISDCFLSRFDRSNRKATEELMNNLKLTDNMDRSVWVAPEILEQQNPTDKADVYSLSMILYQLFIGEAPYYQLKGSNDWVPDVISGRIRPEIPSDFRVEGIVGLLRQMWDSDPNRRPVPKQIGSALEQMAIRWTVVDPPASEMWTRYFRGQRRVTWQRFQRDLQSYLGPFTDQTALASLQRLVVDNNDCVNLQDFARLVQCYGPLDHQMIDRIHQLEVQSWFHGYLTSSEAEKILRQKIKGTFLVRFSAQLENSASLAISVLNYEGQVKHYKILREPNDGYLLGKEHYDSVEDILRDKRESLQLHFQCAKGLHYSQAEFLQENETKVVMPLKALCMRLIFRNQQLFPSQVLNRVMPYDLMEEYRVFIIHSITDDDAARYMWRTQFLQSLEVPWDTFQYQLSVLLGIDMADQRWVTFHMLVSDLGGSQESVHLDTFSQVLELFGPLDNKMMDRVMAVVTKDWFHGSMSHVDAERTVLDHANAEKGTFLVRVTAKHRGSFTVSVVAKQRAMLHYRVHYNRNNLKFVLGKRVCQSLEEVLVIHHRQLGLQKPCPGSKYRVLFDPVE
eukprot:TRINITY_DN4282_c0_g2_i1.p1 TRINITY_DN4282_c0_g2~~TRINITY_DN4282_c0_g2_i1.p1  ORF type:complete len:909 (-),score=196.33 TRINITY_DN4282_c0_g2_i1:16-2667(-)